MMVWDQRVIRIPVWPSMWIMTLILLAPVEVMTVITDVMTGSVALQLDIAVQNMMGWAMWTIPHRDITAMLMQRILRIVRTIDWEIGGLMMKIVMTGVERTRLLCWLCS